MMPEYSPTWKYNDHKISLYSKPCVIYMSNNEEGYDLQASIKNEPLTNVKDIALVSAGVNVSFRKKLRKMKSTFKHNAHMKRMI